MGSFVRHAYSVVSFCFSLRLLLTLWERLARAKSVVVVSVFGDER